MSSEATSSEKRQTASHRLPALLAVFPAVTLVILAVIGVASEAHAQQATTLPTVIVESAVPKQSKKPPSTPAPTSAASTAPASAPTAPSVATPRNGTEPGGVVLGRSGSLTVPTTAEVRAEIQRTPGGVAVVDQQTYANTPARTVRDALDYVPGVFVQPKWGEDSRLSIRGSGLSRNFHTRGVLLYMDGIPITTADGSGDMQEISPTAYRYIEVYKGANGLRYGANALGGAINFVTPTGRDARLVEARVDVGSFGLRRASLGSGNAAGAFDYFVTADALTFDGYRNHSDGESVRTSGNFGIRFSDNIETRFFFNANEIRQHIPGAVRRTIALTRPKSAAAANLAGDYRRNIDSWRLANKTALRLAPTTMLEAGGFLYDRHLIHPIFQYIDNQYSDYGTFARVVDERRIGAFANRLLVGISIHNGATEAKRFVNVGGRKGALTFDADQTSTNTAVYGENQFFVLPGVALVAGGQFVKAGRAQTGRVGAVARTDEYNLWSPKVGILWDVTREAQVFANVSKSGEAPTYSELLPSGVKAGLRPQVATTFEIGTRGRSPGFTWDVAAYHAEVVDEFQCLSTNLGTCEQVNVPNTIHRGLELGFGATVWQGMTVEGPRPDQLWLNVVYTLGDHRFDGNTAYGDNQLPGAPRHAVRAELLYKHPSGFYAGPNLDWIPEAFYVDNANTTKTTAHALIGAKVGFDAGGPWSAYLEARNLADTRYIASASIQPAATAASALFEPGDGRAVYGGLKFRW